MKQAIALWIMALAMCVALAVAAMAALGFAGYGILLWSTAGRYVADTRIYNTKLARNLQVYAFRKCDYIAALTVFSTLHGRDAWCPWIAATRNAAINPRPRSD